MCVLQLTFFTFLYVIYDFVMINDIVNSLLITFFSSFFYSYCHRNSSRTRHLRTFDRLRYKTGMSYSIIIHIIMFWITYSVQIFIEYTSYQVLLDYGHYIIIIKSFIRNGIWITSWKVIFNKFLISCAMAKDKTKENTIHAGNIKLIVASQI